MIKRKEKEIKAIYVIVLALFTAFLAIPVVRLLLESFVEEAGVGLAYYSEVLTERGFATALANSVTVSLASALIATVKARKAFTLAVPGTDTLRESDFFGIASSNKMADKFRRSGLHAVKSERVDAPVIAEYPLTLECEVTEMQSQPYGLRVLGKIVNVLADEKVLDEAGKIDAGKLHAFAFDQMRNGYYAIGEKIGQAWHSGADLMKK